MATSIALEPVGVNIRKKSISAEILNCISIPLEDDRYSKLIRFAMPLLASLVFMNQIKFNPRWKEELVAVSDEGVLILEIAMGTLHVYFPDKQKWLVSVPGWVKKNGRRIWMRVRLV